MKPAGCSGKWQRQWPLATNKESFFEISNWGSSCSRIHRGEFHYCFLFFVFEKLQDNSTTSHYDRGTARPRFRLPCAKFCQWNWRNCSLATDISCNRLSPDRSIASAAFFISTPTVKVEREKCFDDKKCTEVTEVYFLLARCFLSWVSNARTTAIKWLSTHSLR